MEWRTILYILKVHCILTCVKCPMNLVLCTLNLYSQMKTQKLDTHDNCCSHSCLLCVTTAHPTVASEGRLGQGGSVSKQKALPVGSKHIFFF